MARNYTTMARAWANTTMANPFETNVTSENGRWWNLDSFLLDIGIAKDILEETYPGLSLRNASNRTVERLWQRASSDKIVKDWVEYNDKMEELKEQYNMWWWMDNDRDYYKNEEC